MLGVWLILTFLAIFANCVPLAKETAFIGEGTNEIANALLQSHALKNENFVFSPLGLSAILAIFAEGSKGATRDEIASSLHFPENVADVRLGYQTALRRLKEMYEINSPEMRNWFYIYRNYTVEENLKEVLREFYLTTIKSVDRPEEFLHREKTKTKTKVPTGLQGKPTDHLIDVDKQVEAIIENASSPHKSDGEEAASNSQPALFDPSKKNVEKLPGAANGSEKTHLSEKETNSPENKPIQKEEIMVAMQRSENDVDDMTGLSDGVVKTKGNTIPQMIVFNGLYFKGNWNVKFSKMRADDSRPFYGLNDRKIFVETLHAEGLFNTADIPELKSRAIELKYNSGRYSLLILLPNDVNGLEQLTKEMAIYPINRIYENLTEKLLEICIPSFEITTITKLLEKSEKKEFLKIGKIFKPDTADLSGIAQENGLFVEDLVQLVTFSVDSNHTEANYLSASIASSRSDVERLKFNHPFLFYLRDNTDGIIVVNGKVIDPTRTEDEFTRKSLRNTVRSFLTL